MSGMAKVLADHHSKHFNPSRCAVICLDPTCKWEAPADDFAIAAELFAAHQAAMLTAAGFGNVREAKAQALEEASAIVASEEQHQWRRDSQRLPGAQIVAQRLQVIVRIIRARATAVRGET
jgi:hypothetical protein